MRRAIAVRRPVPAGKGQRSRSRTSRVPLPRLRRGVPGIRGFKRGSCAGKRTSTGARRREENSFSCLGAVMHVPSHDRHALDSMPPLGDGGPAMAPPRLKRQNQIACQADCSFRMVPGWAAGVVGARERAPAGHHPGRRTHQDRLSATEASSQGNPGARPRFPVTDSPRRRNSSGHSGDSRKSFRYARGQPAQSRWLASGATPFGRFLGNPALLDDLPRGGVNKTAPRPRRCGTVRARARTAVRFTIHRGGRCRGGTGSVVVGKRARGPRTAGSDLVGDLINQRCGSQTRGPLVPRRQRSGLGAPPRSRPEFAMRPRHELPDPN